MEDRLRLEGLTLTVASVAQSVGFYGGQSGLEVGYVSEPAFAMIKVGDVTIGLLSVEEARKEGAEETSPAQKRTIHVEFTTETLTPSTQSCWRKGWCSMSHHTTSRGSGS
ncbi:MAG: hypothetical protein M3063_06910 [Actinomycetota bacterium]|nr:hypothetical protein [Actinomycetota bacterium]